MRSGLILKGWRSHDTKYLIKTKISKTRIEKGFIPTEMYFTSNSFNFQVFKSHRKPHLSIKICA